MDEVAYKLDLAIEVKPELNLSLQCLRVIPGGAWEAACDWVVSFEEAQEEEMMEGDDEEEVDKVRVLTHGDMVRIKWSILLHFGQVRRDSSTLSGKIQASKVCVCDWL